MGLAKLKICLALALLLAPFSAAAQSANVLNTVPSGQLLPGDTFETVVEFVPPAGSTLVWLYSLAISYDPEILSVVQVQEVVPGDSVICSTDVCQEYDPANPGLCLPGTRLAITCSEYWVMGHTPANPGSNFGAIRATFQIDDLTDASTAEVYVLTGALNPAGNAYQSPYFVTDAGEINAGNGVIQHGLINIEQPVQCQDVDGDGFGSPADGCSDVRMDCDDTNAAINPGATELCNAIDDNCDGITDPGCDCVNGEQGQCGTDVGICEFGTRTCSSGQWGPCQGGVDALATEECNGLDDTCDGTLPTNEADVDSDGFLACQDDCDDNNAAFHPGATELCDGNDYNCNGQADDGCDCTSGEQETCGTDLGICEFGTRTCSAGQWGACQGGVNPLATEACNGLDDTCDGSIPTNEADVDSDGFLACQDDCDDNNAAIHPGATEVCDGVDYNCNGSALDGCDCTNGAVDPCGTDLGICEFGSRTCNNGQWSACQGGVNPLPAEECNGLDDTCDGSVPPDETDADGDGHLACLNDCDDQNGAIHPGATEICDGVDYNCNGTALDGCDCTNGFQVTCGTEVGICQSGSQTCSGGQWGSCLGGVDPLPAEECNGLDDDCNGTLPIDENDSDGDGFRVCENDCNDNSNAIRPGATELCNNIDDNCNQVVDEGCDCTSGAQRSCSTNVGICQEGTQTCIGGQWSTCQGGVTPLAEEACNGLDDTCDGSVPANEADNDGDGFRVCQGDCNDTNGIINPGATEVCNGVDDDCDGALDPPGCECLPGMQQSCGTDLGICVAGTRTCSGGQWGACVGEVVGLSTEECNGLDDTCDGSVPPEEADADGDGFRICAGDCNDGNGQVNPGRAEILYDGLDNDCDPNTPDNPSLQISLEADPRTGTADLMVTLTVRILAADAVTVTCTLDDDRGLGLQTIYFYPTYPAAQSLTAIFSGEGIFQPAVTCVDANGVQGSDSTSVTVARVSANITPPPAGIEVSSGFGCRMNGSTNDGLGLLLILLMVGYGIRAWKFT